jgi:hypothetical protein
MKKHLVIIGIIALLVCIRLSGCQEKVDPEKFIGIWVYDGDKDLHTDSFIFYANSSVLCSYHYPGSTVLNYQWNNYTIIENKIKIGKSVYEFTFSADNQQLILNGDVFNRQ